MSIPNHVVNNNGTANAAAIPTPTRASSTTNANRGSLSSSSSSSSTAAAKGRFLVLVSKRFLALSLASCVLLAFAVGRTARMVLLVNPQQRFYDGPEYQKHVAQRQLLQQQQQQSSSGVGGSAGAVVDPTGSASQQQPSRGVAGTEAEKQQQCAGDVPDRDGHAAECAAPSARSQQPTEGDSERRGADEEGESGVPSGQHLLMDIQNVNEAFLNSEERLAGAMLNLVGECGLTMLSYRCHKMVPTRVSCAGFLSEGRFSIHTWPYEGVITLDLSTYGPASLLPFVPVAEKLFAIPRDSAKEGGEIADQPHIVWAQKFRGFYDDDESAEEVEVAERMDMNWFPVRNSFRICCQCRSSLSSNRAKNLSSHSSDREDDTLQETGTS
jgi:S-adenosylmethionine/arginine decarboxylase-like enzyme